MNIQLTNTDAVNAVLKMRIEKADYQENVDRALRTMRQKANIPGFRQGMVPVGLIRKMYGKSVLGEELNKLVSDNLNNYISENKLRLLGEPLPNEEDEKEPIDFDTQKEFDFTFDIALAPEVDVTISKKDKLKFYEIEADAEMIENRIKSYTSRFGSYVPAETAEVNDVLRGDLVEMADGKVKEDGIKAENVVLTPAYIGEEAQKALFIDAKAGDVIVFNPKIAFKNEAEIASLLKVSKEIAADNASDFQLTVTAITRYKEAEMNQELFDKVFGEGKVSGEEEFRSKIVEGLKATLLEDSAYRFNLDAKELILKKLESLTLPEAFLKRWLQMRNEEMTAEKIEEDFPRVIESLKLDLFMSKFAQENNLTVEKEDIEAQARKVAAAQFAQYGMLSVPDDVLDNFAKESLKKQDSLQAMADRVMEEKTFNTLRGLITLDTKTVNIEEFNKLFQ
jgi:trigger factor